MINAEERTLTASLCVAVYKVSYFFTKVIFVSATKIDENTTNISKLLFFTINLLFVTSN